MDRDGRGGARRHGDPAPYAIERRPLPPDVRSVIVAELARQAGPHPVVAGVGVAGAVAAIPLALAALAGVFVPALIGVPVAVGLGVAAAVSARRVRALAAELMSRVRAAGEAVHHRLRLDGEHVLIEHEHGLLLAVRVDAAHAFVRDVSGITDDPWHGPVDAALQPGDGRLPPRWSWWRIDGVPGERAFAMAGAPAAVRWWAGDGSAYDWKAAQRAVDRLLGLVAVDRAWCEGRTSVVRVSWDDVIGRTGA